MGDTLIYKTAGGVVVNDKGQMLALARTVTRDGRVVDELRLPKGHIDPGETEEQAALREVGEESGYWGVEIVRDLGTAHSSFSLNGNRYERDERYYLMRLTEAERQGAQPVSEEEALFEARWVSLSEACVLLTYPTEKKFALRAVDALRVKG